MNGDSDLDLEPIEARVKSYSERGKKWPNRSREYMARELRRGGYIEPIVELYSHAPEDEATLLEEVKRLRRERDAAVALVPRECSTCRHWDKSNGLPYRCKAGGCLSNRNLDRWEYGPQGEGD